MSAQLSRREFLKKSAYAIGGINLISGKLNGTSQPKKKRPNIVLILADDMGFSDIGCYGGEIETPNLDALAQNGLRFTQFYNSARCCPTRASLLTGLHPHQTGVGWMTNSAENPKRGDRNVYGYRGFLNRDCVTLAEVLSAAGYRTLMSGKWHLGYHAKEKWPRQRGFDRYYGTLSGSVNYFNPIAPRGLMFDNDPIEPVSTTDRRYYITDAFTDYAIKFINETGKLDDRPFFLYLPYTAPHWPLHAHDEEIEKYSGKYMCGWDQLRLQRHKRMIDMGIVSKNWPLSERDAPPWDDLSDKKKKEMDLRMAIYAAQIDRMDQNIGKVVGALGKSGKLENTLILFLADNGGCAEGGELGRGPLELKELEKSRNASYGQAWANASNTPFRKYKHYVHEGGIATPLIVHWPNGIKEKGVLRRDPGYLPDILPTLLVVTGAEYPNQFNGHDIHPLEGESLVGVFENKKFKREKPMCWEHEGNRAIRLGNWKLVSPGKEKNIINTEDNWELYDLDADRTEMNDLASSYPEVVEKLQNLWWTWARRTHVVPAYTEEP